MNTSTSTVNGNWRRALSSAEINIEAQIVTGIHTPFTLPIAPEPVRAAAAPTHTSDAIDESFGVTRPRATRESQHDSRSSLGGEIQPPPYAGAELPAYSADPNTEPVTLVVYLFKFGFLFPPLWIFGAVILISPLIAPVDFEPSKSGTERQQLVQIMRDAELRWAKRCAWALVVLLVLAGVVAAIFLAVWYT